LKKKTWVEEFVFIPGRHSSKVAIRAESPEFLYAYAAAARDPETRNTYKSDASTDASTDPVPTAETIDPDALTETESRPVAVDSSKLETFLTSP